MDESAHMDILFVFGSFAGSARLSHLHVSGNVHGKRNTLQELHLDVQDSPMELPLPGGGRKAKTPFANMRTCVSPSLASLFEAICFQREPLRKLGK